MMKYFVNIYSILEKYEHLNIRETFHANIINDGKNITNTNNIDSILF